jgi:type IV pilus assembly protein PilQ
MAPSSMPPQSQPQPQPTMVNPEKKKSDLFSTDMPKVYTGEKIAIDFFDTDIRNVFKIIAEISGKNFAIDPAVTGKISLTLEKPVPWDQVLDMVLRMNGLDKVEEGDIVRIATVAQLQKEQEAQKNLMIAEKASQAQMVELEPLVTAYLPINYAKAADEMKPHLDGLLTPGRGTLTVDARTNQLIMTDVPAKIRKAKEIIQKLDRVTPQVVIEAKIVEASTDFSRDLGVTWDTSGGIQGSDARAGIGPQKGFDVLNGTYGWNAAVNFPITSSNNGQIGINFTKIAGTPLVINARLYAMEQNNQGRIVSSPKILTLDNKEAFIEQGVEVGYTEKGRTDEVPSVKFKKVTLNLKVTPHVTLDNRISMKIELVKDDILSYYQGVPTINTKKAATELLVDDGDTLVIGGITKTSEKESESGVPGLAKIPLLGWLFKTKSDTRTNEELLIFMTPRIVQLEQRVMINDPGKG